MLPPCTTIIKYYSYEHNPYLKTKSPLEELPIDVALLVLRNLSIKDLLRCSESSKGLRQLTSDDRVWKPFARLIELPLEKDDWRGAMICSNFKEAVRVEVEVLKGVIDIAEPLLDIQVETNLVWSSETADQIDRKHTNMMALSCAQRYNILLRRIDMCSLVVIEKYATILKEKYRNDSSWYYLAKEFVRERNQEGAHRIIDDYLWESEYNREDIYNDLISQCSEKGDFKSALDLLDEMVKLGDPKYSFNCFYKILSCAHNLGNFSVGFEMLRRGLVPQKHRVSVIVILIKKQVDIFEMQKAHAILKLFVADLEGEFELGSRTPDLIKIYVKLGYNQKAWDLANRNHERKYTVFKALVEAFYEKGLHVEFEEAQLKAEEVYKRRTYQEKEDAFCID